MSQADLLIRGGTVVSPWGLQRADVVVREGRIAALLADGGDVAAGRVVDARGRYVLPGLIDPHVHFISGGRTLLQSCEREGPSLLLGGVTSCYTLEPDDVEALWRGVGDGTVDVLASDHIAMRAADKGLEGSVWDSRAGMPGSGTILPLLLSEGYHRRGMSLSRIAAVSSANAARIFNLYPRKGAILPGSDADLVVVDLEREVEFQPEMVDVDFSPLTGTRLRGWPVMTILGGRVVMEEGEVKAEPGLGQYLGQ